MRETADFYIANGCQLVWLIFPERKTVELHRLNAPVLTLGEHDHLEGEDVVPGFVLSVGYLFEGLG